MSELCREFLITLDDINVSMANIKFNVISTSNPSNLNVRFYHGRGVDCNAKSNILIDPKFWSNKMQNLKPSIRKEIKDHYRIKTENLKNEIIFRFNDDFSTGEAIDSKWLNRVINNYYKRPEFENDYKIFFIPFIQEFIEESKKRINHKTGKKISDTTINRYKSILNLLLKFEKEAGSKIEMNDISLKFHNDFTNYLKLDCNYSNSYIHRIISQIKSFLTEAKMKGYEVNIEYESKKFTFSKDESIDTYLNEKEIHTLFEMNLSDNEKFLNIRDLFIIGLWTGLRIGDLKRISEFHFSSNTLIISATEKTNSTVEIPIHPQVKEVLRRRRGELPRIISVQKFNKYVKELCKLAGFTDKILGSIKNPKTNRKERGYYEKYRLISSHICRRSFATNLYGKIDDKTIMAITTHRSHSQFMSYIKTTQKEHVTKLAEFWENQK